MLPTKESFLKFLKETRFQFSNILDVGVLKETADLRILFPDTNQILIEPQKLYLDTIRSNYAENKYELLNLACGKEPGVIYLHGYSINDDSIPTHSQISYSPVGPSGTINTSKVRVDTLDNITRDLDKWLLLKIDVDGKEIEILEGAEDCLKKCGFVIVEATSRRFPRIVELLTASNFSLFNIVDICYLKNMIWQVDLVYINNDIKDLHPEFNPRRSWKGKGSIFKHHYKTLKI